MKLFLSSFFSPLRHLICFLFLAVPAVLLLSLHERYGYGAFESFRPLFLTGQEWKFEQYFVEYLLWGTFLFGWFINLERNKGVEEKRGRLTIGIIVKFYAAYGLIVILELILAKLSGILFPLLIISKLIIFTMLFWLASIVSGANVSLIQSLFVARVVFYRFILLCCLFVVPAFLLKYAVDILLFQEYFRNLIGLKQDYVSQILPNLLSKRILEAFVFAWISALAMKLWGIAEKEEANG